MKSIGYVLVIILALSGCAREQESARGTLDIAENNTKNSWAKFRDMLGLASVNKNTQTKISPRYCYTTYGDVICYAQPLTGEEERLTGFQQASGHTGYSMAEHISEEVKKPDVKPPAPAKTEKKPVKTKKKTKKSKAKGKSKKPVANSKDAKPSSSGAVNPAANAAISASPKEMQGPQREEKKLKEVIFDPSELEPKQLVPTKQQ